MYYEISSEEIRYNSKCMKKIRMYDEVRDKNKYKFLNCITIQNVL